RAVVARQPRLDARVRYCPVSVGSDQVLLQLSLLDKNDGTPACAPFYLHLSSPSRANEHGVRSIAARPVDCADVVDAVGWRGMGRSLDRVFISLTRGRMARPSTNPASLRPIALRSA